VLIPKVWYTLPFSFLVWHRAIPGIAGWMVKIGNFIIGEWLDETLQNFMIVLRFRKGSDSAIFHNLIVFLGVRPIFQGIIYLQSFA